MAKLNILWSNFAANQLDIIFQYLLIESNKIIARTQINEILELTQNLSEFPLSGNIEIQLENEFKEYRCLIKKHIKIIYTINMENKEVRILDLFDTRQNPKKITRAFDK